MIGVLETCECGRKFLRGIYPQQKCEMCDGSYWHGRISEQETSNMISYVEIKPIEKWREGK